VAAGFVISDSMEPLVALHHLSWHFLFFGVWTIAKRRKFKLTHYPTRGESSVFLRGNGVPSFHGYPDDAGASPQSRAEFIHINAV